MTEPLETVRSSSGSHDSVPFSVFMADALYDPDTGFYSRGGRAGGSGGDFLTSPEVGPLFGAVLARALDRWWREAGSPDPWIVVEAGAGPGTLARSIRLAEPDCAGSLVYVMVEVSEPQRGAHGEYLEGHLGDLSAAGVSEVMQVPRRGRGPCFVSTGDLPEHVDGVVLANELLDNLPVEILRWSSDAGPPRLERLEVMQRDGTAEFVSVTVDPGTERALFDGALALRDVVGGQWFPLQVAAMEWLRGTLDRIGAGRVIVVDYGAITAELVTRPAFSWLRTYRHNHPGGHPLEEPGSQDITCDVALDQLAWVRTPDRHETQAEFLRSHGIEELVAQGREMWKQRAHAPDRTALIGRSRVGEAEALLDPAGLGDFFVSQWIVSPADGVAHERHRPGTASTTRYPQGPDR